ncbi:MAG TPA: PfkB family carbohydrate kinase, partial [Candidatus Saccharimonadia bacterium]|nr:PfkB family carbohydrate kinase [Candidatus Saccharimonadia bacterium]
MSLGDIIVDVVVAASGPLVRGSDRAGEVVFRQGGSAANVAVWVARSGGESVFIGAVGRDEWGRRLRAALAAAGVEARLVTKHAPTARIAVIVEADGERSFVTDRGAADLLLPGDLRAGWFRGHDRVGGRQRLALHLPGYSLYSEPLAAASRRAVELARGSQALVSVDMSSHQPILDLGPAEARSRIAAIAPDLLFGNVAEVEAILGGRDRAVLLDLAPIAVVKDGARGATILHHDGVIEVPTTVIAANDTTGAGDAFAAGFLVRWLASRPAARHDTRALTAAAWSGHRAAGRLLRSMRRRDR